MQKCKTYILLAHSKKNGQPYKSKGNGAPIIKKEVFASYYFIGDKYVILSSGEKITRIEFDNYVKNGHPRGRIEICDSTLQVNIIRSCDHCGAGDAEINITCSSTLGDTHRHVLNIFCQEPQWDLLQFTDAEIEEKVLNISDAKRDTLCKQWQNGLDIN